MSQSSLALALAGISFMIAVIWGTPLLRVLRHLKIGKAIRVEDRSATSPKRARRPWAD